MTAPDAGQPAELRVLVSDDDRDTATLIAMGLIEAGIVAEVVHSYVAGVERATTAEPPYDAVVQDNRMPDGPSGGCIVGMGRELVHNRRPTALVGVTADEDIDGIRDRLGSLGLQREVLPKPFPTIESIADAVHRALGRH